MVKTDSRHYNTKSNRDLTIEMNLWCAFNGKQLEASGETFDSKPVSGQIIAVEYLPDAKGNTCLIKLQNGTQCSLPVKRGKLVLKSNITIK